VKIYTKTGDGGETSFFGGARVFKDHHRVAAYGDVDETNAAIGAVRALSQAPLDQLLFGIQKELFAIGTLLADPTRRVATKKTKAAVTASHLRRLEKTIDARETKLPPLRSFVLPGGTPTASLLHQARTVCRRAERSVVTLARNEAVDPKVVVYLNRLSDLLFVLARFENHRAGLDEQRW
jgi:cob(I)alamin adenosyltransferase